MKTARFLVALLSAFTLPLALSAQVQLVTVPERDSVELTLYRDRYDGFAFVRETRPVTLRKGVNTIPFSWVGMRIARRASV